MSSVPKRAVVFGGHGLLGAALLPALETAGVETIAPRRAEVDITELQAVRSCVERSEPEIVINLAAEANVDQAEREPRLAYRINGIGAQNVALAARDVDAPVLHTSTDYVFDGRGRRPYRELDPTGSPPSQYGQSKLLGEQLVRQCTTRHYIVRVAALFGRGRRAFVDWIVENANAAKPLTIVDDRFVSPSFTDDVAAQMVTLIESGCTGTYHATGQGVASWYDLARKALELTDSDPAGITPIPDEALESVAQRPVYSALDNHLLRLRDLDCMRPWDEALAAYLAQATLPTGK